MRYTGRISLVMVSLLGSIFEHFLGVEVSKTEILFDLLFTIFAWFVGTAFDKLKFLSEKDFLTEVYNRRYVDKIADNLFNKAKVKNHPVSVIILDVNNFKKINDTYGHHSGDLILQIIAKELIKKTRECDVVSRWGGDEFLILSPGVNALETEQLVSRILKDSEVEASKYLIGVKATLSVGDAIYPSEGKNLDDLIRAADEKMYKNKYVKNHTHQNF